MHLAAGRTRASSSNGTATRIEHITRSGNLKHGRHCLDLKSARGVVEIAKGLAIAQERILEMSRRYEGLQREADASAEALLRSQADVRRLEGDCEELTRKLADAQAESVRLSTILKTTKVRFCLMAG